MRPEDVRFHHFRDYPWPQKFCVKCGRMVSKWHQHWNRDKGDKIAWPEIEKEAGE